MACRKWGECFDSLRMHVNHTAAVSWSLSNIVFWSVKTITSQENENERDWISYTRRVNKVEKIPKIIDPMKMKLIVIQVFEYSSTIRNPWEKNMVGLCLCWDRGGWWSKRLCLIVFFNNFFFCNRVSGLEGSNIIFT